jgi:hypothetical protein
MGRGGRSTFERVRHGFKPGDRERGGRGGGGSAPLVETRDDVIGAGARGFWCAACMTRVTDEDDAIDVGGAHQHRFVNPAGVEFEIGCFADARCRAQGEPTLEATWFAGLAWSYALCANCGAHLGWAYRGEGALFWGLILARLVGPL